MDKQYQKALNILKNDGVIIYPTDTTYGLGCNILSQNAIDRIYQIKGRDFIKPLSIACSDLKMISDFADISDLTYNFLEQIFPGAVTLLLKKKDLVSNKITANSPLVGVRMPDYKQLLEMINILGSPIVTTSANITGKPDSIFYEEIDIVADFTINGECIHKKPSTIIDITKRQIIRKGTRLEYYQQILNKYL